MKETKTDTRTCKDCPFWVPHIPNSEEVDEEGFHVYPICTEAGWGEVSGEFSGSGRMADDEAGRLVLRHQAGAEGRKKLEDA